MNKTFIKVIKKLAKAGVTPNELTYILFAQMHEMMLELHKKNLTLQDFLDEIKRELNDDEMVDRVNDMKAKQ